MAIDFAEAIREELRSADENLRYAALRRVGPDACDRYFNEVANCLGDASWRVRKAAVAALVFCSDTLRLWTVIRPGIASQENAGLRSSAAELMQRHRQILEAQLIELTHAGSANLRKVAIEALSQESSEAQVFSRLLEALEDSDANVRAAAVEALAGSEQTQALQALRDILAKSKNQDMLVQLAALKGLAKNHSVLSLTEISSLLQRSLLRDNAISLLAWAWEPEAVGELTRLLQSGRRVSLREAILAIYQRWQNRPSEREHIKAELSQVSLPADTLHKLVCQSVHQDLLNASLFVCSLSADKKLVLELYACMEHFSNVAVLADVLVNLSKAVHFQLVESLPAMPAMQQQHLIEAHAMSRPGCEYGSDILKKMLAQWASLSSESFGQLIELISEKATESCAEDLLEVGQKSGRSVLLTSALKQIGLRRGAVAQQAILQQAKKEAWSEFRELDAAFLTLQRNQNKSQDMSPFSAEFFSRLAKLVRDDSGLELAQASWVRVERRVRKRMSRQGITQAEAYLELLQETGRNGALERQALTEMLTVHETYFFREPRQLHAVENEILPDLIKTRARERKLRFWSAGCSTGEEAYTLAMLVRRISRLEGWDVHITGTDVSLQVVQKAREACYQENSFRADEPLVNSRDFERHGERLCVKDEIKKIVSFYEENLVLRAQKRQHAQYDLIMCRNVFIYFAPQTQRRVARMFFQMLRPGGYLLLGHAESLLSYNLDFEVVTLRDDLVYRRSETSEDKV